jgi:hypothetical protein
MLMNEGLSLKVKPFKTHARIMIDQPVLRQCIDVQSLYTGKLLAEPCERQDKIIEHGSPDFSGIRMGGPVGAVHCKVGEFYGRDPEKTILVYLDCEKTVAQGLEAASDSPL